MQVNFLAPQTQAYRDSGLETSTKYTAIGGITLLALTLITAAGLFLMQYSTQKAIEDANSQIASLQQVEQNMQKISQAKHLVQEKSRMVEELDSQRPLWQAQLAELTQTMPQPLSLTTIRFSKNTGKWDISGAAQNHAQVAQLAANLQGSRHFASALISTSALQSGSRNIAFDITSVTPGGGQK